MYASSPALSSIVVITVEVVTRSPTRTGMSPIDARLRRGDAVVPQLDPAFAHLRVERRRVGFGRAQRRLRLFELLAG